MCVEWQGCHLHGRERTCPSLITHLPSSYLQPIQEVLAANHKYMYVFNVCQ